MKKNPSNNQAKDTSLITRTMGMNFSFFRKYYFPEHNKSEDASFHGEVSQVLQEMSFHNRGTKFALAAPRGSAKSTLVTLQYALYSICYSIEHYIIIASSTAEQAETYLGHIKTELTQNERLIRDFPNVCETGRKPGPPRWKQNEIITRNNVKVTTFGSGQQIRGRRHQQFRPSLIILDDIEGDEEARNQESYYKLYDWLTKAILKSGDTSTNVIFLGTIHHYNSLLAQFTDEKANTGWLKKIYRSIISWANHQELWEKWKNIYNFRQDYKDRDGPQAADEFFNDNKELMLEGAQVLWPQQYNYYKLMKMREDEGQISFDSEMQNDPVNPRDCLFNLDEVHYWDDAYSSEEELLNALGDYKFFYGACDPSLGRQNKHGDYSAIVSVVMDREKGIIYVLDADIERRRPDNTIDTILEYHKRRDYNKFGFETNQFQEFMASELEKRSAQENANLPLEEIKHSSDKRARIEVLQPLIKNGTIRFSRRHHRLLEQMRYFPKGAHDDGLDALEMAVGLCKGPVTIFDIPNETYDQIIKELQQEYYFRRFHGYY